jgi:antitoxin YefM
MNSPPTQPPAFGSLPLSLQRVGETFTVSCTWQAALHKAVNLTAPQLGLYSNDQNSGHFNKRSPMAKTLSLSEVKTRLPELVAGVQEREEEVIVTKNGRPAAILINIDEYTRLKETLDVLSDPGLMSQIAESRAFYKTKHTGLSFEDVFGEPLTPVKKRRTA